MNSDSGNVRTKPSGMVSTKESTDAQWKMNGRVKCPGKPPTSPKSSGMKKGSK